MLGTLLATILALAGLLHIGWAAGLSFPFANEQALARSVVGRRGITVLPSRAGTGFVGVLLLAAALAAWIMGQDPEALPREAKLLLLPSGLLLTAVFLVRAVAGILPAFERSAPEEPYLTLNRRLYSPLCAFIAAGFLVLTFRLPNWNWWLAQIGFQTAP
ncbi:DUF3995 domain-containing protein [Hyphomonas sp.]|uniref:DUF3995 domain-containing protein n=1 Tax=Hyphomonas sp. TaxID=87 RepID=UPI0039196A0F